MVNNSNSDLDFFNGKEREEGRNLNYLQTNDFSSFPEEFLKKSKL